MKNLTIKIPNTVAYKLIEEATRQKTSRSFVAREALAEYFVNLENKQLEQKGSCLELTKDLCGCDKGPADLSTQAKHLEGYGE